MSLPYIMRRLAQAEFDDAAEWYALRSPKVGTDFTNAVDGIVFAIAAAPQSYPVVHDDTREAIVPGFPYAVYYRVEPTRVIVVAVYHTSRDPAGWQSRN